MLFINTKVEEELEIALKAFPSHFVIDENTKMKDCPFTEPTIKRILDRIKDGESEHLHDSQSYLQEHFGCRDLNLTLFMEYKLSSPGTPQQMKVVRMMTKATQDYPDNMIAWSNLAHLKLLQHEVEDAKGCLKKMKAMGPWELVLGDAEMAYTYRRLGPRGHENCKILSEKLVNLHGYQSLTEVAAPIWLDELKVEYSYEAALVIQRLLNASSHSTYRDGDRPEVLMKESVQMLKTVVFSTLGGLNEYRTIGWLMLSETFRLYKKVHPSTNRTIRAVDFGWPGLDQVEQCLEKAVKSVETAGLSNTSFRALHMLGNEFRNERRSYYDLDKAERYLKQAAELSRKPAIQHHLALVYRDKWLNEKGEKCSPSVNIRDPGHQLLKKAITHLEKADEYSHGTSVLFRVELARLKFSHSKEPISEESRDDIMDILNGCLFYSHLGLTTWSIQSYLSLELALMHKDLFNDKEKYRQYLELSVEKAVQAKAYCPALSVLKKLVNAESPTESERYKKLGKMYMIFERYSNARWNLERAREFNPDDPDILEDLVVSLIGLEEFQAARQCLMVLRDIDHTYLEKNRDRYIDVSLKVAQQFGVGIAASIYKELIENLRPKIAADTIVVISSEEPSDTVRTKALVAMIRRGLGLNEDNCILPMEAVWKQYGDMDRNICGGYLEDFVKKAWCIVIHLTDVVMGEGLESLLRDIDNCIEDIWKRKGHIVVVDDVTTPGSTDWKRFTGKMRRCQQWVSYHELFLPNPEMAIPEEANSAEQVEVPRDEQALELVEECAAALQGLQIIDPSNSTVQGRGGPLSEVRQSTGAEGSPTSEQRESPSENEREAPVTKQGCLTESERMEASGNTQHGGGAAADEVPASDQSNSTAAEGTDEGMSVIEAPEVTRGEGPPETQSWNPSALERLIRAMLSASQSHE